MKARIRQWFGAADWTADKWLPILISLALSAGTLWVNNVQSDRRDEMAAARERLRDLQATTLAAKNANQQDYERVSDRFDNVAQAYAGLILTSGKVDVKAKNDLLANLLEQDRTVQRVTANAIPQQQLIANRYRSQLAQLSEAVQNVSGVEDMAPYWQRLNDALATRRDLDGAILGRAARS